MSEAGSPIADTPRASRLQRLAVVALLALAGCLAVTSLLGDSITYDETSHLTAGMSYLVTGDYRLAPDHPPLAKMWAAWPLLLTDQKWVPEDDYGWQRPDPFLTGQTWLFELNDGEHLLVISRMMMVVLLLALCGVTYAIARSLFGRTAGLLTLALAALSPTLLAHGRLVTTDLPVTLCLMLSLLMFARLLRRVTWWRLLGTAAALGAASVTKMSWPLVLPAMLVMALVAVLRKEPPELPGRGLILSAAGPRPAWRPVECRGARVLLLVALGVFLSLTTWASIWSCYRWRVTMSPAYAQEDGGERDDSVEGMTEYMGTAWVGALYDEHGQPRPGLVPTTLRFIAEWALLPDAYTFGLAWTLEATSGRKAYFWGEYSDQGWYAYFPVALAIKTPIAVLALFAAGAWAVIRWRRSCADPLLLAGLLSFALIHFAYAVNSSFNIGHRHLLPIYPALLVVAGASAAWLRTRAGRWLIPVAVLWLAGANLWIHPHYLSYFNEIIGGPANGHRYLADSNIDWGQDLKRLGKRFPGQTIKLAYFGSAVPTCYGFECELLPSAMSRGSVEPLAGGGLYVVSVTELLGVYNEIARDTHWEQPSWREYYRQQTEWLALPRAERPVPEGTTPEQMDALEAVALDENADQRWGRFLYNLRRRPPDERIGWSLWVYSLTAQDVDELTRP